MKLPVDRAVVVGAVVLAADLVTKQIAFAGGTGANARDLLPGVEIDPTRNEGIAFSLLEGRPALIFALIAAAVVLLVTYYLRNRSRAGLWLATGLMLGGAAGNAIDRIVLGYVRDFVSVGAWPTFNVADMALTAGVVVLVVTQWRQPDEQAANQSTSGVDKMVANDDDRDRDTA